MLAKIKNAIFGEKMRDIDTRKRPVWFPDHEMDTRILGERFALLTLTPYKPPHRRYVRLKAWVDTSILHRACIIEIDLDERKLNINGYK
jgi:hypothetical protein